MSQPSTTDQRLAILIDADNVPPKDVLHILGEAAIYGRPTIKRIYGDFTSTNLQGWSKVLNEHAITPIQQYRYTVGKNASDSALIIDAIDMLHTALVDAFVIVSSDSDFTRLATRLREGGKHVYGIGEEKTPRPFINACDKFTILELLRPAPDDAKPVAEKATAPPEQIDPKLIKLILSTIDDLSDETEWLHIGRLSNGILKKRPDFDPRNYGKRKFISLLAAIPNIELRSEQVSPSRVDHYVRHRIGIEQR